MTDGCGAGGEITIGRGSCLHATIFTINLKSPGPGLNSSRRVGKPATNCLDYSMAQEVPQTRSMFNFSLVRNQRNYSDMKALSSF